MSICYSLYNRMMNWFGRATNPRPTSSKLKFTWSVKDGDVGEEGLDTTLNSFVYGDESCD